MEPDAVELRILGCLIEKQRTTPDAYPLSLNALRLACNQSTNRDPVVAYDEATIRDALQRLYRRRWTRLAGAGRASKYRHLLDEALGLQPDELALLAVLLLRGPQTPGELNQRVARLHPFGGIDEVHATLERLIGRELVSRLPRRPGQKEERYVQLLGETDPATAPPVGSAAQSDAQTTDGGVDASPPVAAVESASRGDAHPTRGVELARIEALEREVAELREQLRQLRSDLGYER